MGRRACTTISASRGARNVAASAPNMSWHSRYWSGSVPARSARTRSGTSATSTALISPSLPSALPACTHRSMWATGGFVFFGVPMFGLVLGSIASVMVNPYMERKFLKKFNKASKLDVGSFLEAVASGDDDVLTYGEYLEFCMLNAYDAKPGQVRQLRSTFHSMDGSLMKDGRVTRRELMRWVVEHEEKKDSPNLN